jgi:hypothetical protein
MPTVESPYWLSVGYDGDGRHDLNIDRGQSVLASRVRQPRGLEHQADGRRVGQAQHMSYPANGDRLRFGPVEYVRGASRLLLRRAPLDAALSVSTTIPGRESDEKKHSPSLTSINIFTVDLLPSC